MTGNFLAKCFLKFCLLFPRGRVLLPSLNPGSCPFPPHPEEELSLLRNLFQCWKTRPSLQGSEGSSESEPSLGNLARLTETQSQNFKNDKNINKQELGYNSTKTLSSSSVPRKKIQSGSGLKLSGKVPGGRGFCPQCQIKREKTSWLRFH